MNRGRPLRFRLAIHFWMRSSEWLHSLSCAAQAATSCATTFPATFTKPHNQIEGDDLTSPPEPTPPPTTSGRLAGEQDRDRVLLLANPQGNPGNQVVSAFGCGARREQREALE